MARRSPLHPAGATRQDAPRRRPDDQVQKRIRIATPDSDGQCGVKSERSTPPILLPADHYFFRPEVLVTGGDFLYLSAPKPIVAPGTPFTPDLQAWIRNSDLAPDWLRIGTDIIDGMPVRTFNMTFSLTGATIAGTPGQANCHGQSVSGLSADFGGELDAAASALGFSSVKALQAAISAFCNG